MQQISEFGNAILYLAGGAIFVCIVWLSSWVLAPSRPNPEKLSTYECGEEPMGNAFVQFNPRFYVVGLVFLIFEVDILFLFPWASIFADTALIREVGVWGVYAFVEMLVFVLILVAALVYVWAKGDLEWVKPKPTVPANLNPVPESLYEELNQRLG